jgi:hypothetical protein
MDIELIEADESVAVDPGVAVMLEEPAPFPVEALPACLANLVRAQCVLTGQPAHAIASALLSMCAGVIGNLAVLQLSGGWREACSHWTILVAVSGSMKSSTLGLVKDIAKDVQDGDADSGDVSYKKPLLVVVGEATIEALAKAEERSPRGVLYVRDELAALFDGMNQYRGGKGADRAFWLEAVDGGQYEQIRKDDSKSARVPHHLISIVGTIQPETARKALLGDPSQVSSGLVPRFQFVTLERKAWVPVGHIAGDSKERDEARRLLVERLCRIRTIPLRGDIHPHDVQAVAGAQSVLFKYGKRQSASAHLLPSGLEASMLDKSRGMALRFALMFSVLEGAGADMAREDILRPVSEDQAQRAVKVAAWCAAENKRTYRLLSATEETGTSKPRALELAAECWKRNGMKPFLCRDFQRMHKVLQPKADELLKLCMPQWECVAERQNPKGGQPVMRWQPFGWRPSA